MVVSAESFAFLFYNSVVVAELCLIGMPSIPALLLTRTTKMKAPTVLERLDALPLISIVATRHDLACDPQNSRSCEDK